MTRGVGVTELLADLGGPLAVAAAVLTQLGDVWFLTLAVALTYWYGPATGALDRRRAAMVVGCFCCALAAIVVLKPLVGAPRPPGAGTPPQSTLVPAAMEGVYAWLSTADGHGVPSGHALAATVVYGALAWAVRRGRRRSRLAAAAALVALVSLTRLVLGVHYLVDVVVGASTGLVLLAIAFRWLGTPTRVLATAAGVAVAGLAIVGPDHELLATVGLCAGAAAAWFVAADRLPDPTRSGALTTVLLGLGTAGPAMILAGSGAVPAPLVPILGATGGALLVVTPQAGEHLAATVEGTPIVR